MENPYRYILDVRPRNCTLAQISLQGALINTMASGNKNISIKKLCSDAFVARSTFYAYYDDIDGILLDIEDHLIDTLAHQNEEMMDRAVSATEDLHFYSKTLEFVTAHRDAFYTLLVAVPDVRFIEKWKDAVKYHFWERLFRNRCPENSELILELVASSAIAAFTYWMKNPETIQVEGIYSIISGVLRAFDYNY